MPGLAWESPRSRSGSKQYAGGGLTREFFVLHEPDHDAARALVEALTDVEYDGFSRKQFDWESLGYDMWRFTVTYGAAAGLGSLGLRPDQLNFRLGTATRHVTQSLQTLYRLIPGDSPSSGTAMTTNAVSASVVSPGSVTPADADVGQSVVVTGGTGWTVGTYLITALVGGASWQLDRAPAPPDATGGVWHLSGKGPNTKGAIGQSLDTVQGADAEYPVLEFSLASRVELMNFVKLRLLRGFVRRTNSVAWNGFAPGELLYLGCEPTSPAGTLQDATPHAFWNLAHHFRYEPNQTNVRVGEFVIPFVGGHEYVWARYGGEVSNLVPAGVAKSFVQKPVAVYVERLYDATDFELLGIVL